MKIIAILVIICAFFNSANATEISVNSVILKYEDNITDESKVVIRELHSLHDDEIWSKPHVVDIEVEVENLGKDKVKFISIKTELYHLLSPDLDQDPFPAMKGELKTLIDAPTWVWTNNLGNQMITELLPGEKRLVYFKGKTVRSNYYATDYLFHAFAVRVFASPRKGDEDYSNNANQKIINYGD